MKYTVIPGVILTKICDEDFLVATGPLTEGGLAGSISELTGGDHLSFFDAVAPIVTAESVDMTRAFRASR